VWIRMLGLKVKVIKSKVIGVENESLNMNVWMNEWMNEWMKYKMLGLGYLNKLLIYKQKDIWEIIPIIYHAYAVLLTWALFVYLEPHSPPHSPNIPIIYIYIIFIL